MQRIEPDFTWVGWTPETMVAEVDQVLAVAQKEVTAIAEQNVAMATFASTFGALHNASAPVIQVAGKVELLGGASPDVLIRDTGNEQHGRIEKALLDLYDNEDLYRVLSDVIVDTASLSVAEQKFRHDVLVGFEREGFHLPKEVRQQAKALSEQIIDLKKQFSENIAKGRRVVEMSEEDLEGLPESYITKLPRTDDGAYVVSTDYPDYQPFMRQARRGDARRRLYNEFNQRAADTNAVVLPQLVTLRQQRAMLLGYKHHGDYTTAIKMAQNADAVFAFLHDVNTKLIPLADKDLAMLTAYKEEVLHDSTPVETYDIAYLSTQLRKEKYNIDPNVLAEYFPFEHVFAGMLKVYSRLFGITFVEDKTILVWQSDVQAYRCLDTSGELLGIIFIDLFPREGKFSHAGLFTLLKAYEAHDIKYIPACALVTNFTAPTTDRPSLLQLSEVQTLFHEFGHALHHTLSTTQFITQSGTSVAYDFVEAPSQALEFWLDDNEVLNMVSSHYQTGATLPQDIRANLAASDYFLYPTTIKMQLSYALYDMLLHTESRVADVIQLSHQLKLDITKIPDTPESKMPFSFGHLAGYDAGYYGYLWSEVFAADIASIFQKEGYLNPDTGQRYRNEVLAVGSSRPEHESLVKFLGREPNSDAFFAQFSL